MIIRIIRIFLWMLAGAAIGWLIIGYGEYLERYPLLSSLLNYSLLPADYLMQWWANRGFGPYGDSGFILCVIFPIVQYAVMGLCFGLFREWRKWCRKRMPLSANAPQTEINSSEKLRYYRRMGFYIKSHKVAYICLPVLLLAVCGYCFWQERLLAVDRDFFLHQVDHKAVGQACLDMLPRPGMPSLPVDVYPGNDSRLPEAIRRLNPTLVSVHGNDIAITKTPRPFYNCLTLKRNWTKAGCYDLVYQEGCNQPKETILGSFDKKDDPSRREGSDAPASLDNTKIDVPTVELPDG